MTLSFNALRAANIERDREYEGSETIDLAFRGLELAGEVGELCNLTKKIVRNSRGIAGNRQTSMELWDAARDELADAQICLDLLAMELGIDLGAATIRKFDATSKKLGLKTRLYEGDPP